LRSRHRAEPGRDQAPTRTAVAVKFILLFVYSVQWFTSPTYPLRLPNHPPPFRRALNGPAHGLTAGGFDFSATATNPSSQGAGPGSSACWTQPTSSAPSYLGGDGGDHGWQTHSGPSSELESSPRH